MTVRVGFIGGGQQAGFHARSLAASGADFAFAGVHDADGERAAALAALTGAPVWGSAAEVIEASDAVYVCTWTSEHPRLVGLAAAAGTAVFCEKPLATGLDGARSMAEAVAAAGIVNQVGLVLRSSNAFVLLRHLIEQPESGRLLSVTFHDDQYLPVQGWYQSSWRADADKAGSGVLLEHSIHDVDLLEQLGGPLRSVCARSAHTHGIPGIEDLVAAGFAYTSWALATLNTVWHDVPERLNDRRVEVVCERLWASLEGDWIGPLRWQVPGSAPQVLRGEALLARVTELGLARPNPDGAFVGAVAAGVPASPDFADALRAHVVVDATYRSAAADGAPVEVPPPRA
ncbi:MAG TPA: Gfo/Idh/MocA family oxidoreductase [Acidimicrobiales bacterium]